MNIEQLITPVPTLVPGDTGTDALDIMQENNLTELPVITDDSYVALVQEHDLQELSTVDEALKNSELLKFKPSIFASAHPFEAMRLLHQMNLSVLPVTDHEQKYLGAVTAESLLKYVTENSGIDTPGGILVLEVHPRNYTLFEIARICENEDVIVMNLQVHPNEQGMLEITLKLNRSSLEAVAASFERFKYHVKAVYGERIDNEDIAGKYDLLMNYINM